MKIITRLISFLVGGLFIFSGLIKLNDPTGTEIKLEEYFTVFKADKTLYLENLSGLWDFLMPFSLVLAIVLTVLEVVLGINMLLHHRPKTTIFSLFGLILFFTFLTFYSWYFDKVKDCGCFGDAIPLTPFQSFMKDVILTVMIVFLLFKRNLVKPVFSTRGGSVISILSTIGCIAFGLYTVRHLPVKDFRAYKVGANLPKNMKPAEKLKYGPEVYIYNDLTAKKDVDISKEDFTKNWKKYSDTLKYKFVKLDKPLLNPDALPKITDYKVFNKQNADVTTQTLTGQKFFIVIPDIAKTKKGKKIAKTALGAYPKINELVKELRKAQIQPLVLTAAGEQEMEQFRHQVQLAVDYYFVDKKVLKTMVRANPGLMLLQDGTVKGKWHHNDMPKIEEVKKKLGK